jgi:hypothetical protein
MTGQAYYNETDPFAVGVLKRRIADGSLPPGDVDAITPTTRRRGGRA